MAHGWRSGSGLLTAAAALTLALAAPQARALSLGEPELRSALGESLDLRIPVTLSPGESIEPRCFSLASDAGTAPGAVTISIERSLGATRLRIRSAAALTEPGLALRIVARCQGLAAEQSRDYSLSLQPPTLAARAATAAAALQEITATLIARIGDTLESIARAIFPDSRPARTNYIEALRQANPELAQLGQGDPVPPGSPIALPDLRTYAKNLPRPMQPAVAERPQAPAPSARSATPPRATPATAAATTPPREPAPRAAARPAAKSATQPAPAPSTLAPSTNTSTPKPAARRERAGGYVLKLSEPVVDLSRSGAINERQRAQLRDRLLVLDADDQVAAFLALRNSVRQLESRVSELQLKLAGMPSTFPALRPETAKPAPPKAEMPRPEPARIEPPRIEPPKAVPPKIEAPKVEPAKVVAPKVEAPKVEPPKVEAPKIQAPKTTPAPVPTVTAKATAPVAAPEPAKPAPDALDASSATSGFVAGDWIRPALWALAILLLGLAALLAAKLARRGRSASAGATEPVEQPSTSLAEDGPIVVADEIAPAPAPAPDDTGGRAVVSSDAGLVTRLAEGDTDDVRRRYIQERFPELANGTIGLDDPASVIKGARLFYEDGAIPRAVELLQFSMERRPAEVKPWLALFEIFRLEGLKGQYADLAHRFQAVHGKSDYWPKVQYFGREVDSGNALYRAEAFKSLETIGPGAARRAAAEQTFDPVTENWLNAPMDFENEVLANDLRKSLMSGAGVTEQDLVPNPMPALRNVEMFRVA